MKDNFEKTEKNFKFGHRDSIKITKYLLRRTNSALRVEVRRFTKTSTVEIELLTGDNVTILKHSYEKVVLQKPTKKQVDDTVEELIQIAIKLNLAKEQ